MKIYRYEGKNEIEACCDWSSQRWHSDYLANVQNTTIKGLVYYLAIPSVLSPAGHDTPLWLPFNYCPNCGSKNELILKERPPRKKCKHCGREIEQIYSWGQLRWYHLKDDRAYNGYCLMMEENPDTKAVEGTPEAEPED